MTDTTNTTPEPTDESIFRFDGEMYTETTRAATKVYQAKRELMAVLRRTGQITERESARWDEQAYVEFTELIEQAYFNARHS